MTDLQALSDAATRRQHQHWHRDGFRFDHDETWPHHHDADTQEPVWWEGPMPLAATPVVPAEGLREALDRLLDASTNYINADEPKDYAATEFVKARHHARAALTASPSPDTDRAVEQAKAGLRLDDWEGDGSDLDAEHHHDPFDPVRWREWLSGFGHRPLDDGRCEHRWRSRVTRAVKCRFLEGFRLGLAAPSDAGLRPSPDTDAGLDVARLARAIEQHRTGKWYDPVLKTDFEEAEGIAAEYARLATPSEESR